MSVKTGDNTPIALFVFLLAAGACAGLAVAVKIKKGKKERYRIRKYSGGGRLNEKRSDC